MSSNGEVTYHAFSIKSRERTCFLSLRNNEQAGFDYDLATKNKGLPACVITPLAARTQHGFDALVDALQDKPGPFLICSFLATLAGPQLQGAGLDLKQPSLVMPKAQDTLQYIQIHTVSKVAYSIVASIVGCAARCKRLHCVSPSPGSAGNAGSAAPALRRFCNTVGADASKYPVRGALVRGVVKSSIASSSRPDVWFAYSGDNLSQSTFECAS